ncbi:MAG: hypothetical protein ISS16_00055 [Ignavibacteria bacterium]|nr:hypothetical protein [Ignavibacteria bacterium]
MEKLGFKVFGVNGFKKLRGIYAVPKIKPRELGNFVCSISQVLLKLMGLNKFSYGILCVKEVSQ